MYQVIDMSLDSRYFSFSNTVPSCGICTVHKLIISLSKNDVTRMPNSAVFSNLPEN
jgi:hypothetical protein